MNKEKVSIIVPVYNVEKYLVKMIDSVLGQTHQNFELLLIDDGSTDNSLNILREYEKKDSRIRVFTQANDGAPGKARNWGIDEAKGEYLYFLDADDFLPKNAMTILLESFTNNVDLVIGRTIWTDGEKEWYPLSEKKLSYKSKIYNLNKMRYYDLEKVSYVATSRLYRKKIIKRNDIKFPHKYSSQDTFFSIIYNINCQKIKIIPDVVYYRLERQDVDNRSQVQIITPKSIRGRVAVFKQIVNKLMVLHQFSLAYYFANVGIISNYNRLDEKNIINFKDIFIDYKNFYDNIFNKSFYATKLMFKAVEKNRKNSFLKYINLMEKMSKGRIKWRKKRK